MLNKRRTGSGWWVAVVAGMASYLDAAAITGFSTAMVIYQQSNGFAPVDVGVASGTLTASIAIGALIGGRLGDRIGRRPVFIATMVMIFLAAATLVFSPSMPLTVMAAAMLGLGVGADLPVSLSAISEAAPNGSRGKLLGFSNLLWVAGIMANAAIAALVGDLGLVAAQIIFCHIAVVALLVLAGRLTIPESRSWREARSTLTVARKASPRGAHVRELFRSPYGMPFAALIVFYSLTNLVANTNGQFGTYVLVNFGGESVRSASTVALLTAPLVMLGLLWFMRIADTPRRFSYFTAGAICGVLAPLTLAIFGVGLASYAASAILGAVAISFAFEAIMKVWTQETFPTLLRSTAQGAIISIARFAAAMLAAVTPLLLLLGPSAFYLSLAAVEFAGVATAWFVFRRRRGAAVDSVSYFLPFPGGPGAGAGAGAGSGAGAGTGAGSGAGTGAGAGSGAGAGAGSGAGTGS
jgi:MFS transporter, SP family, inositol transporter